MEFGDEDVESWGVGAAAEVGVGMSLTTIGEGGVELLGVVH